MADQQKNIQQPNNINAEKSGKKNSEKNSGNNSGKNSEKNSGKTSGKSSERRTALRARVPVIPICVLVLLLSLTAGLCIGSVRLSPTDILRAILTGDGKAGVIVRTLRLPRVLGAALAGAALASSGLLLQTVTGNDLAAPGIIGVNAGAGFFVILVLALFPAINAILPAAAFIGAVLASGIVLGISGAAAVHRARASLVLAGVAVSSLFNAGIAFLSQCFPDVVVSYVWFSTGGFNGVYMNELVIPAVLIVCGILLLFLLSARLELLCLGDDIAGSLGVNVRRLRLIAVITAGLLAAAAVTYAGLLGFVGLMVPHIARRLAGHRVKRLAAVSILTGASLVVLADMIGRSLFSPSEITAGVILAMIGAPFFVFLLFCGRVKNDRV